MQTLTSDFALEVARGNVPNVTSVNKFADMDAKAAFDGYLVTG